MEPRCGEQSNKSNRIESRIESQEAHKTGRGGASLLAWPLATGVSPVVWGRSRARCPHPTSHARAAIGRRPRLGIERAERLPPACASPVIVTGVGGPDSNRLPAVAVCWLWGSGRPHEMSCPPGQGRRRGTARGQAALMRTHQTALSFCGGCCDSAFEKASVEALGHWGCWGSAAAGWTTLRLDQPTCLSSTFDYLHLASAPHHTTHRRTGPCHDLGPGVRLSTTSGCLDLRRARLPFEWGRGSLR